MKIKNMAFKVRYLAIGLIALEIASIPVSAKMIDKMAFKKPQRVVSVPFPPEAGITKFLVSSDAPFAIISENAMGEYDVSVNVSGLINGKRFGSNAQMPRRRLAPFKPLHSQRKSMKPNGKSRCKRVKF